MPRTATRRARQNLTVKAIEALKPRERPYRISDGGGLLLEVKPSGARVWLCRLTVDGRRRDMGLGGYPLVGLAAAREAAEEARRLVVKGKDPIAQREADAQQRRAEAAAAAAAAARTFAAVAEEYITRTASGWKHGRTADLWRGSLKAHAMPVLGPMPIDAIDRAAVLRAVDDVWRTRAATGRKIVRRIGAILRYAAAHGWRSNDNAADVKMLRNAGLPVLPGGRKQPALPWRAVPAFYAALRGMEGAAPLALRLLVLTALRSGEVRGARWSEFDLSGEMPVWTVAAERMKGGKGAEVRAHRVPLAPAALDVLAAAYAFQAGHPARVEDLPRLAPLLGDALVFPGGRRVAPLSDMSLSAVMRRMNATRPEGAPPPWRDPDGREAVPHGFRSSFRTWTDDTRPGDAEAAERALAHHNDTSVSERYRRSDMFGQRVPLMEAWAAWCSGAAPVEIIPMKREAAAG
ncbi:integrase arm-type DNA-binding domain-containing protein [Roseomonas sp. GC11]|uniref:tyrosine-type recombinase/integrase n=1 Tax=Roseomonas sp. GC11 TaxID=2950546 RepID=UPI00210906D6|nr:site-specific integrase [Roseomonas sp. GC11]MCQ4161503.1 integrase arm-type DNA-binding domain-containing protein [Roseomonas sp. GC11]